MGEKRPRPHVETGVWSVSHKETQGQVTELVLADTLESAFGARWNLCFLSPCLAFSVLSSQRYCHLSWSFK